MPFKCEYDPENNAIYEIGLGEVTYQDFQDLFEGLYKFPIKPGFKTLSDYCNARLSITSDQVWLIKGMSDKMVEFFGGCKLAIAAPDTLAYGLARMFTMTSDPEKFEIAIFTTRAEACAWLGIKEPNSELTAS